MLPSILSFVIQKIKETLDIGFLKFFWIWRTSGFGFLSISTNYRQFVFGNGPWVFTLYNKLSKYTKKNIFKKGLYIHDNIHLMLYAFMVMPRSGWNSQNDIATTSSEAPYLGMPPPKGLYPTHKVQATSSIKVL